MREALLLANNTSGYDIINFHPSLFGGTIDLNIAYGDLGIRDDVFIDASGGITLNLNDRNIRINEGCSLVRINQLDLYDGFAFYGGAIDNDVGATLILTNLNAGDNYAEKSGGVVFQNGGNLIIDNCTFNYNSAYIDGGAILFKTTGDFTNDIVITNTLFQGNASGSHQGRGDGAAIALEVGGNVVGPGSMYINNTDFIANLADGNLAETGSGGAIFVSVNEDFDGVIDIRNSYFGVPSEPASGNSATNGDGGAVYLHFNGNATGNVWFTNAVFYGNSATQDGGAVSFQLGNGFDGNFAFTNCSFLNNSAGDDGGGLEIAIAGDTGDGTITIAGSTFSDNTAGLSGGSIAFFDYGTEATLFIGYSAIIDNGAGADGGGLWAYSNNGQVTLVNSTVAYNDAIGDGGGIYLEFAQDLHLAIFNSTIAENAAGDDGGGIFAEENVYLLSTIVANNHAVSAGNDLAGGGEFHADYSLISATALGNGSVLIGANKLLDVDPLLGPLADNGGLTATMALAENSPAIGHGSATLALTYDQRGPSFARVRGGSIDIGAYEFLDPVPAFVVGSGAGMLASVQIYNKFGELVTTLTPFGSFTGGLTVAMGDVNNDGIEDIIVATGPGGGPHVKVFDGDGFGEIASFFAFDAGFKGGLFVAAGDVDDDGFDDIIVAAGPGGGPHVRVFDVTGPSPVELESFFAFGDGFSGGTRVGAGDFNGDGAEDIILAAGPGGGPHVRVVDVSGAAIVELESFFAFDNSFRGGVFVSAGDVNGDGLADVIVAADAGGGPHVRAIDVSGPDPVELAGFFAYGNTFRGGVRVGATDLDGDGDEEIVTGPGGGGGPHVRIFGDDPNDVLLFSFFAFAPEFTGGLFVA